MAIITCERCGKQTVKLGKCNYCNKLDCLTCIKSSKIIANLRHLFICKSCWSNMKSRKEFKSK